MKKTINNHFIQKAFAKNFSNKGMLKWTIYNPNKEMAENIFDVNEKNNGNHPIVIKNFHSQEIEDGMNEIESEGIKIINKIAYESNNNIERKITLKRNEIFALKFYNLLALSRTEGARSDYKNLNGDASFNYIIKNAKKTSKEIQEDIIEIIINEYKKYKNREPLESLKTNSDYSNMNYKDIIYILIANTINSRLLFFTFKKNKLFLQETIAFQEISTFKLPIYDFMAITPNVGIMFYFDPMVTRGFLKREDSWFFKTKISTKIHQVNHINKSKIDENLNEFMLRNISLKPHYNQDDIHKWNIQFSLTELGKYHDKNDLYIYDIFEETEEVQDICNAMSLVQNKDKVLIYIKKEYIADAELQIKTRNIGRVEDNL